MVKITKVYTRTGDKGETSLAGKHRVSKTSARVTAYGTIDELNSFMGFAIAALLDQAFAETKTQCLQIQHELFNLGSQLAVLAQDRRANTPVVTLANVERLEQEIDAMNAHLPILNSFILPGGNEPSARLHLARTVCRRAEREMLRLHQQEPLDDSEIPYINRLSDWLFVAARYVISCSGDQEVLWKSNAGMA